MAIIIANPTENAVNVTNGILSRFKVKQYAIQPKTQKRKKTYVTRLRVATNRKNTDRLGQPGQRIYVHEISYIFKLTQKYLQLYCT